MCTKSLNGIVTLYYSYEFHFRNTCDYRQFLQDQTNICLPCKENCKTCNTLGDCTECMERYQLIEKNC
jgi:hypothetical protein